MIYHNFKDAISEGDSERIIRCWKFFLPYLKADGAASRKYCLEGLHLLLQVNCLSETESQRLNLEQKCEVEVRTRWKYSN